MSLLLLDVSVDDGATVLLELSVVDEDEGVIVVLAALLLSVLELGVLVVALGVVSCAAGVTVLRWAFDESVAGSAEVDGMLAGVAGV